jgi:hypothetical protein
MVTLKRRLDVTRTAIRTKTALAWDAEKEGPVERPLDAVAIEGLRL